MKIKRIVRHLLMSQRQVKQAFGRAALEAIEQAIKASEMVHSGEIRFVIEAALDGRPLFRGQTPSERALDVFSQLRIWDTEHNTGVLIYVLLADRAVEIIADRGIYAKAPPHAWALICQEMQAAFKAAKFQDGALSGIRAVTQQLVAHFPAGSNNSNELTDQALLI